MSYYYDDKKDAGFHGKKIAMFVQFDEYGAALVFLDGSILGFKVEGDCCSHSWIEHVVVPDDLAGAVYYGRSDSGDASALPPVDEEAIEKAREQEDYIAVYQTFFRTSRGEIAVEYRNSSNGYYGGYVVGAEFSLDDVVKNVRSRNDERLLVLLDAVMDPGSTGAWN